MTLDNLEFYIVVPVEATNEISNPSVEAATTGYTASGAGYSIARSSAQQRRGLYSLAITTASGVVGGVYYSPVNEVSTVARTFALDVKGTAGQVVRLQIRDNVGTYPALSEQAFTLNGYWQRIKLTRTGTATTTRRLYLHRDAVASTDPIYTDGWYYGTVDGTYFDGDSRGFVKSAIEYRWNGTPHASTSWRSGQTRSGGTLLRIKDYARIISVLGLGMASVSNIATPLAGGNSLYQDTKVHDREFIFNLAISGLTPGAIEDNRAALINAVRPDRVSPKQPLVIRYQGLDSTGADASEPVDIYAHYVDGLQDLPGKPGIDKPNMRFISYFPMLSKSGESGVGLGYQTTVANFRNIGYRDVDGTWKAMGVGANESIKQIAVDKNGIVYAAGIFTSIGGVATTGIAKWDGSAWTALGTGASAGSVNAIAISPANILYVGGSFPQMGGVANTAYVAKWDGANWTALGTGMNNEVNALAFGADGTLYAGGWFTTAGGVAANYIAKWNGSAWSALGTGMNARVNGLAYSAGWLWATGVFTTAGGTTVNYIAKWNTATSAWQASGSGLNSTGYAVVARGDGAIFVGGSFTTVDGIAANYIAVRGGGGWKALGSGVNALVTELAVAPDGSIYVGGQFTTAGGMTMPDRGAIWQRGTWLPLDVNVQDGSAYFYAYAWDKAGRLYLGGSWVGTDALSATVTAVNTGNAGWGAYPVIRITGPGTIYQIRNWTTGKTIVFNSFSILNGEIITLDTNPKRLSLTSDWRTITADDLWQIIAPGSLTDWHLQAGANNVSLYMLGTTGATSAVMTWQDLYWSIDGAKR